MTAPSTFTNSPHDGRVDLEPIDRVEVTDDHYDGHRRGGATFVAGRPDRCVSCPSPIKVGEMVTYGLDDALEHVECPDVLVVGRKGACPACHVELPTSGVCGSWSCAA